MTVDEVIARQAQKIIELEDAITDLQDRIGKARLPMICIGGPLNDNKLGFSKEQRAVFHRIDSELGD